MARKIRVAFTEAEVAALLGTLNIAWQNAEDVSGNGFVEHDIDSAEQILARALQAHRTAGATR